MVQAAVAERKKKDRSPSYPAIDLETALERARQLLSKEGRHYAPISAILQHWGYATKSSGGLLTTAALKKFGLLEDQGSGENRKARITDLAYRILIDDRPNSEQRAALIREAALTPPIHAELWHERGPDGSLPSDVTLRFTLRTERGFTETAASDLINEFRQTIAFAGLDQTDTMSGSVEDKIDPAGGEQVTPPPGVQLEKPAANPAKPPTAGPGTQSINLPLDAAAGEWATLVAPFPLTKEKWDQMLVVLEAMKPALIAQPKPKAGPDRMVEEMAQPSSITAEAQELLQKVDDGGVPTAMTENLRRIATENGIAVTPDMSPNSIIDELQEKSLDC